MEECEDGKEKRQNECSERKKYSGEMEEVI